MTEYTEAKLQDIWPRNLRWFLSTIVVLTLLPGMLALFATHAPLVLYATIVASPIGIFSVSVAWWTEYSQRRKIQAKVPGIVHAIHLSILFCYSLLLWYAASLLAA